jgi:competence protein ComEA
MPTTPAERKALLFLGAVVALGVGVRAVGRLRGEPAVGAMQPALERQLAKAEGAARLERAKREAREREKAEKGSRAKSRVARAATGAGTRASRKRVSGDSGSAPVAATPLLVDVDTADSLALATLPGVGPALARRIISERMARGAYGSLEALDQVSGVGPRLLERLAPHVTFSGPRRPILGKKEPADARRSAGRRPVRPGR